MAVSWGGELSSGTTRLFVDIPAGEPIFLQGDAADEMFFIQDGQVDILYSEAGGEAVLRVLQPGEFLGTASLLGNLPRAATARARSDCRLLRLDKLTFEKVVQERTDIALEMIRRLSHRLQEADKRLLASSSHVPPDRQTRDIDEDTNPMGTPTIGGEEQASPHSNGSSPKGSEVLGWLTFLPSGSTTELIRETTIELGRGEVTEGEPERIDMAPFDPRRTVSRRHVKLICSDDGALLRQDTATVNGTYVNGIRLGDSEEHQLQNGDQLRFGLVEARFSDQ